MILTEMDELKRENENLKEEIQKLKGENEKLKQENEQLSDTIDKYLDDMALEILEFFNRCRSIRETADAYYLTPERLVDLIPYWNGCSDGLQTASDYRIYVRHGEDDDDDDE